MPQSILNLTYLAVKDIVLTELSALSNYKMTLASLLFEI